MRVREMVAGFVAGAVTLVGTPAFASPPAPPAPPVTLIVGLRSASVPSLGSLPVARLAGALRVRVPSSEAAALTRRLSADPAVEYVEPDHVATAAAIRPDDPGYAGQWGIVRTNVDDAWALTRGSARVTIAIVDTGVARTADLAPRLLAGHDFVNNDDDATDDNGHGTMAAGVAAGTGNNRIGVAGVCWACRILPVKVLGATGGGSYSAIAEGIRYAADRGATVINLSLGGGDDSKLLRDAVDYAAGKGSLVIAAAGNQGSVAPHYPAAIPSVLAVGAVDRNDRRYPWSNYGSDWVDVTAPGCNRAQGIGGAIGDYCGTSSATPFVTGVAGLLAATDPAPPAASIRAALVSAPRVDALRALAALPVRGDRVRPAVVLGATPKLARGVVRLRVAASDQHGVAQVRAYAGGKLIGVATRAPYAFRWSTPARGGVVALDVRAYDRAGNVTALRRYVRVARAGRIRVVRGRR
jgi:thermitase